ncbi:hypothetical protein RUND412_001771 [Rhizina undulata]
MSQEIPRAKNHFFTPEQARSWYEAPAFLKGEAVPIEPNLDTPTLTYSVPEPVRPTTPSPLRPFSEVIAEVTETMREDLTKPMANPALVGWTELHKELIDLQHACERFGLHELPPVEEKDVSHEELVEMFPQIFLPVANERYELTPLGKRYIAALEDLNAIYRVLIERTMNIIMKQHWKDKETRNHWLKKWGEELLNACMEHRNTHIQELKVNHLQKSDQYMTGNEGVTYAYEMFEKAYEHIMYPNPHEIQYMSAATGLSYDQVYTWFFNAVGTNQ